MLTWGYFLLLIGKEIFAQGPSNGQQTSLKKIDASNFEKVEACWSYINFFLDKSKISADVLGQVIAQAATTRSIGLDVTLPLICLV